MTPFTTETLVRVKFRFDDQTTVPQELVLAAMADAHNEIRRFWDGQMPAEPPPEAVMGETLLSGANVLRSLAWGDAVNQRNVLIGGNRIEAGERFEALMTAARVAEDMAWFILEPFLKQIPPKQCCIVTPSQNMNEE